MKGRSVQREFIEKCRDISYVSLNLIKLTDDCSGCYTIPARDSAMCHATSYWHNVQKLPYLAVF